MLSFMLASLLGEEFTNHEINVTVRDDASSDFHELITVDFNGSTPTTILRVINRSVSGWGWVDRRVSGVSVAGRDFATYTGGDYYNISVNAGNDDVQTFDLSFRISPITDASVCSVDLLAAGDSGPITFTVTFPWFIDPTVLTVTSPRACRYAIDGPTVRGQCGPSVSGVSDQLRVSVPVSRLSFAPTPGN
jgi:hypothetical protein